RLRGRTGGVAILGEPGSGRTWAARELVRDTVTFLDAARIVGEGEHEWSAGLLSVAAGADGGVVVVEHVHLAPDPVLALLSSMLSDPAAARLVLTADPLDDVRPPVRELLARCPGQVRVPALRQRIRELGDLASALARELDRPDLRLGPSALTALSERSWPGNLAELRAVLAAIPERESPLPVRVEDLPVEYRATSRVSRLGGRERAEREAIIEALRESGGNKVHAAARLGISRTTLYSRIRALGIAG
ncbi:Fis family transcriptional regulator, partial [Rhodococcus rhodochrous]